MADLFTCKGKGGTYEDVGTAVGAGTSRGEIVRVYRDTVTGNLYYRAPTDFAERMESICPDGCASPDQGGSGCMAVSGECAMDSTNATTQTDLSKKLRKLAKDMDADSPMFLRAQLQSAAEEIERYYGGMLNWKATAEAKDQTISDLRHEEIDLSKAKGHHHPDINTKDLYLCKIAGRWYIGKFSMQWYGLNFEGYPHSMVGLQFDAPGWNASRWERVLKFKEPA